MRKIKLAAAGAGATLDLEVSATARTVPITGALRQPGRRRTLFLDVPVRAIVSLGHKIFAPSAHTWRALLAGLHGKTWTDEVIGYFESEIGSQEFPPPDSNLPLELVAYGGIVEADNGMHRLVAAICWLAATQGADAVLRKVRVHLDDVWPTLRRTVVDEVASGHEVEIGLDYLSSRRWLRIDRGEVVEIFLLEGNDMRSPPDNRFPPERMLDRVRGNRFGDRGAWENVTWRRITPHMADALKNDDWLKRQLVRPLYTDLSS